MVAILTGGELGLEWSSASALGARGPDSTFNRTDNSLGQFTDDFGYSRASIGEWRVQNYALRL